MSYQEKQAQRAEKRLQRQAARGKRLVQRNIQRQQRQQQKHEREMKKIESGYYHRQAESNAAIGQSFAEAAGQAVVAISVAAMSVLKSVLRS